ncbi:hypothetical protein BH18ACT11_BH18ACT11_23170 [soil metagenome]
MDPASEDLRVARAVRAAALAVPGIYSMGRGMYAEAATYGAGAKVVLTAKVRRGGEVRALTKAVRGRVSERLGEDGLPVARIKIEVAEVDPRQARVK